MRVTMLLENNAYPQDVRVRNEAEALVRAGHHVHVIAPRAPAQPRRQTVEGVEVERFALPRNASSIAGFVAEYGIAHLQLYVRAARALVRGAEVLHLHNPPDTLFVAARVARRLGRRAVYDHHDLFPELFEEKFGRSRVVALLAAAQRASVRSADLVIATNESQADAVRPFARNGTEVVVVRNGPRRDTLAAGASPRTGTLADPRLVFLGSLAPQDGVEELPALLSALRQQGLDPRLTVVGDGPSRAGLEREIADRGLSDVVTFEGWVDHERVPKLLAAADICVDPAGCSDLNHRSTMIKISEYLAAARPTVAYELVETKRTAGDAALYAGCGESAAFSEQVERLARDGHLRAELAARALERVRELVWERSERALVEAYERLP